MNDIDYILNGKKGGSRKKSPVSDSFLGTMTLKPSGAIKSKSPDVSLFPSIGSNKGVNNSPKTRVFSNDSFLRSMVISSPSKKRSKVRSNDSYLRSMVSEFRPKPPGSVKSHDSFLKSMVSDFKPKSPVAARSPDSFLKSMVVDCRPSGIDMVKSKSSHNVNMSSLIGGKYNPDHFLDDIKTEPQKKFLKKTSIGSGRSHERFWDSDGDGVIDGLDCFREDPTRHGFRDRLRNLTIGKGFKSDAEIRDSAAELAEKRKKEAEERAQSAASAAEAIKEKQRAKFEPLEDSLSMKEQKLGELHQEVSEDRKEFKNVADTREMHEEYIERALPKRKTAINKISAAFEKGEPLENEDELRGVIDRFKDREDVRNELTDARDVLGADLERKERSLERGANKLERLKDQLESAKRRSDGQITPKIRQLEAEIAKNQLHEKFFEDYAEHLKSDAEKYRDQDKFSLGKLAGPGKLVYEQNLAERDEVAINSRIADLEYELSIAPDPAEKMRVARKINKLRNKLSGVEGKIKTIKDKQSEYEKGTNFNPVKNVADFTKEKVSDAVTDVKRGFGRATGYAFLSKEARDRLKTEDVGGVETTADGQLVWVEGPDGNKYPKGVLAPDIQKRVAEARRKLTPEQIKDLNNRIMRKVPKFDNKGNPVLDPATNKQLYVLKGELSPADAARETLQRARIAERDKAIAERRVPIMEEQDRAQMMYARVQQAQSGVNLRNYALQTSALDAQLDGIRGSLQGNRLSQLSSGGRVGSGNFGYSPNGLISGALPPHSKPTANYMDAIAAQGFLGGPKREDDYGEDA